MFMCYYYLICFPSIQCHVFDTHSQNADKIMYMYMYLCFMTDQLSVVYFNHTFTRLLGIYVLRRQDTY